jgi:hypothetical protein
MSRPIKDNSGKKREWPMKIRICVRILINSLIFLEVIVSQPDDKRV